MFLASKTGIKATDIYWKEVIGLLEGVAPECTKRLGQKM
jgi:hypothetical protein